MLIVRDSQVKKLFYKEQEIDKILDWNGNVVFEKESAPVMTNTIKFHTIPDMIVSNDFTVTYTDSTTAVTKYSEEDTWYTIPIPTDKTVRIINCGYYVDEVIVSCKINLSKDLFPNAPNTIRLLSCDSTSSTNLASTFSSYGLGLIEIRKLDVRNITSIDKLFYSVKAKSIVFDVLNSSSVNIMSNLFQWANVETLVGLDSLDTSNVTTMESMFYYCKYLTELDLSKFNTSNLTNIRFMFYSCTNLTSLNLSGWDLTKVPSIKMLDMFRYCDKLTTIRMIGCNQTTIDKIKSALSEDGILNNVTIVTE